MFINQHKVIKKIADFLLYSNIWIALCALAMLWQTEWIIFHEIRWDNLSAFILFSTLFLYAVHRLTGLKKLDTTLFNPRFETIKQFDTHIILYALIGLLGTLYTFFHFEFSFQIKLLIPSLLSLGYVIPVINGKKRLRDLNFVKILLISIVWSWVTVILPIFYYQQVFSTAIIYMVIARSLFIFSITLPFDIRDLDIDLQQNVATIPSRYGLLVTKRLGWISLGILTIFYFMIFQQSYYSLNQLLGLEICVIIIAILIHFSRKDLHDYFFTFLVDGMMILQFLAIFIL